jgi:putative membrane protein
MTLEGLLEFEQVRDFLYSRMRGARGEARAATPMRRDGDAGDAAGAPGGALDGEQDLAGVLAEVAAELRALRLALEATRGRDG